MANLFTKCLFCDYVYNGEYNLKQHLVAHFEGAIQRRETAALGRLVNIYNEFGREYNITNFNNYRNMMNRLQHSNTAAIQDFYNGTGITILGFLQQPANVGNIHGPPPTSPPRYEQAVNDMPNLQQPGNNVINIDDLYNMREQFLLNEMDNYDNNYMPNLDIYENGQQFLQHALNEIEPQNFVQQNQQVQQQQQQQQVQEINVVVGAPGHPTDAVAANNVGQNNLVFVVGAGELDVVDPVEVNPPPPPQNLGDRLPQEQQHQQQRQITFNAVPTAGIDAPVGYGSVSFRDLPQQRPRRFMNNLNNFRRNFRPTITTHILIEEVVETDMRRNTSRAQRTIQKTIVKRL